MSHFTKSQTNEIVTKKGLKLFCRIWPSQSPRALVFISHGWSDHAAYYDEIGSAFAARGILAFSHDHYGHGRSEGKRAYVETVDHYVDDVIEHCLKVKAEYPNVPLFINGHSMGGMIALTVALKHPAFFEGMVFQSPLIIPFCNFLCFDARPIAPVIFALRTAVTLLDWWNPELVLGWQPLSFVTADLDMRERLRADGLRWHGGTKVRLLLAFASCLQENFSLLSELRTPFLALHGTADWVCNVKGSRILYEQARTKDKDLVEYEGARHNLYLEVKEVRDDAINRTVEWVLRKVEKRNQ